MITKKKLIVVVVLILAVVLGFNFFGKKKTEPLQLVSVKKQNIESTVSSSGALTGKSVANLKFKSGGKLAYINVKVGDRVKQYQVIAGLDTQDLTIALQQARNTLTDKQATVDKIHDDVKGHDADESFIQRQSRTTAEVAANNAYDSVKAAERAFQDAVIISPIAGVVTQAIQTSGQNVSVSDLIAQVVDMSAIYFDTEVDEADIGKVASFMPVDITLDAYPNQIFKGKVDQILPQTKTSSSGSTIVTVRIVMDNPKLVFVNGLSGESSITYQTSQNTLTIPIEALRDNGTVMIQTNNKLKAKKVETGISSDTDIEIKSGLSENDQVILNPPAK